LVYKKGNRGTFKKYEGSHGLEVEEKTEKYVVGIASLGTGRTQKTLFLMER